MYWYKHQHRCHLKLIRIYFFFLGEAVRCWTCSSDLNPYCNDPFLPDRAPESSGLFRLEYCDASSGASYPYLASSMAACKKQKKYGKRTQNIIIYTYR